MKGTQKDFKRNEFNAAHEHKRALFKLRECSCFR